jgi:hypothetical protein
VTALTLPSLALAALALWRHSWWPLCLAVAGVAPAGVSLVAGGFGLPVFYVVALFAAAAVALRLAGVTLSPQVRVAGVPGAKPLLAFGIWAVVVTVAAPALFPGMAVLGSAPGHPAMLVPGAVTSSNVAQLAYLWIAIGVIVLLASAPRTHPYLVGVPAVGIVALSFCKYVSEKAGLPFPTDVFDNNPSLLYIQTAPGGAERFRGILSEPASLATYCLAAAAFAVAMLPRVAVAARVALVAVLGISIWLGIASTSTTFVVAGALLCGVGLVSFVWPLVRGTVRIAPVHAVVLLGLLVVAYVAGPALLGYVNDAVTAKSGAESYNERSGADAFSIQVALRSLGFGVGLGANRPSSFGVMLLSNVGVVGVALFAAAVALIVRHALRCGGAAPTIWVLVAILAAKLVSGPDLADPSGLLYLCLGALAGLRVPPPEPPPHPPSQPAQDRRVSSATA